MGAGPLEIRGSNPVNGTMSVTGQRIYRDDSTFYDDRSRHPQLYFENSDSHNHWHLKGAARFSLWNEAGTAEVAPGAKVGFCLQDVERVNNFGPGSRVYSSAATEYCKQGQPNASSVFEGISPGWQDVYAAKLPFQWVNVTDMTPGRYRIAEQVDPDDFVRESNEQNNGPTLAGEVDHGARVCGIAAGAHHGAGTDDHARRGALRRPRPGRVRDRLRPGARQAERPRRHAAGLAAGRLHPEPRLCRVGHLHVRGA